MPEQNMIFINVKNVLVFIAVLLIVEISCHPKIARKDNKTGNAVNKKSLNQQKKSSVNIKHNEDVAKTNNDLKLKRTGSSDERLIGTDIHGNNIDKKFLAESDELQKIANVVSEEENIGKLDEEIYDDYFEKKLQKGQKEKNCWMNLKSSHFEAMDALDVQYSATRKNYQSEIGNDFENQLMSGLLFEEGAAERAKHQAGGIVSRIPAGINLGGYCMMRMPKSVLFFHRMKLRNQTMFRVNFLNLDLENMALVVRLSLNDLHLLGAYERASTERDPTIMYYIPNFGEVQIMMKNVNYKMEGRLRLINNRLIIELVNSEIITREILMMYVHDNKTSEAIRIQQQNIEEFVSKLKSDLDLWLKDFFNDYLMYHGHMKNTPSSQNFLQYEKKKTVLANEYADYVIDSLKHRLRQLQARTVKMPHFTIYSVMNMKIKLHNGVLRGLDSIYRRSVATTRKNGKVRNIDTIVGFSKLKAEYTYDALTGTDMPTLRGSIILTADELTAHMAISQINHPPALDVYLDDFVQTKPESLTLEGPGNRVIANFKQVLEHAIIAILSSSMMYNVNMIKSLTRCEPNLHGNDPPGEYETNDDSDPSTSVTENASNSGNTVADGETNYGTDYTSEVDDYQGDNNNSDNYHEDSPNLDSDNHHEDSHNHDSDNYHEDSPNVDSDNYHEDSQNHDSDNYHEDSPNLDSDNYHEDSHNHVNGDYDSKNYDLPSEDSQNVPHLPSDTNQDKINTHVKDNDKNGLAKDTDYFLTKNDSLEVEVPVNGKVEKMKIKSYNEFKLKQIT